METAVTLRLRANAAPVFTEASAGPFTVAENETAVGRVMATDDDPGDNYLRFRISGGVDRRRFEINAESGNLGFKSAPNYEMPSDDDTDNVYEVEVEARSGEDRLADSEQQITNRAEQTITVTVLDVDEQPAKPAKPELKAVPDSIADSTTSLYVNWKKPGLNGGPEITGYNVAYRAYQEGTDGDWTALAHSGTAVTAIITGLRCGHRLRGAGAGV